MDIESIYEQAGVILNTVGDRWNAPCPFHSEKKPSFVVYSDGGYHCFGCGAHGTLQDIADYAGIEFFIIADLAYERDHVESELFLYLRSVEESLHTYVRNLAYSTACSLYDMFDDAYTDVYSMAKDTEYSLVSALMHLRRIFKNTLYETPAED